MEIVDLQVESIAEADWNPNELTDCMRERLRQSIERFGLVAPLVVRAVGDGSYETIGGAQRLAILRERGVESAPCVVVQVDDVDARLLSQCLNQLHGDDNLGVRAALIRKVLAEKSLGEVLSLLPDSADALMSLSTLGEVDLASSLRRWQADQRARLRHLTFQLVPSELETVQEALDRIAPAARETEGENPNARGKGLYLICKIYLEREGVLP